MPKTEAQKTTVSHHHPYSSSLASIEVKPAISHIIAQFKSPDGELSGPPLNLPANVTPDQLQLLLNNLLNNEDPLPYLFTVNDLPITTTLQKDIIESTSHSTENTLIINYLPQSVFRVKSIGRCSSSLEGHTESILCVCFSPDGTMLATGSGDTTVRVWDLNTETPMWTMAGHSDWVQVVSWSPNCRILVSGSMDKSIRLWDPKTGSLHGTLKMHMQCVTSISWEPMHLNVQCRRFASGSKDGTVRIWDAVLRQCQFTVTQHTAPVMCVRWGGEGLLYTGSRDKTIKVWDTKDGNLVRSLEGHAHWINHLALNTDHICRTGPFDHTERRFTSADEMQLTASERYKEFITAIGSEKLVSGSDDFTMILWDPTSSKKPITRMTGHQQLVNHVCFSPDGRMIASASFDKSVKLWDGKTGKFISTLRGHVGAVYQVCWSSDSRQILSGSKDSTLKCWDVKTRTLKRELPGHADEVFSVDWSPSGGSTAGDKVASGGKDKILKIWKH